jgi:hypothetical protein
MKQMIKMVAAFAVGFAIPAAALAGKIIGNG